MDFNLENYSPSVNEDPSCRSTLLYSVCVSPLLLVDTITIKITGKFDGGNGFGFAALPSIRWTFVFDHYCKLIARHRFFNSFRGFYGKHIIQTLYINHTGIFVSSIVNLLRMHCVCLTRPSMLICRRYVTLGKHIVSTNNEKYTCKCVILYALVCPTHISHTWRVLMYSICHQTRQLNEFSVNYCNLRRFAKRSSLRPVASPTITTFIHFSHVKHPSKTSKHNLRFGDPSLLFILFLSNYQQFECELNVHNNLINRFVIITKSNNIQFHLLVILVILIISYSRIQNSSRNKTNAITQNLVQHGRRLLN
ncbi:hypothetical protein AGLY_001018 [Aphis glycines]|uniref:Uncharacterized protein n=1 Tax=Aphis glycines TaxID=307491 RepID=A0A6G0U8L3_APHGL|nr:hypothetical protein AGLY_001018 [Aphis glycines]